ncbi:MAG: phosphatase PAP2 family protein [Nitrospirae bacterium]|nr:MAG: phosphatase PAP2 family protein [Nitrospirota bacterium]
MRGPQPGGGRLPPPGRLALLRARLRPVGLLLGLAGGLALLTLALRAAPVRAADRALFLFVQHHLRAPGLDPWVLQLTMLGDAAVGLLLLLAAALVVRRPFLTEAFVALAAAGGAVGWMKHAVRRLRPSQVLSGLHLIGPHLGNLSYPSGHTATAVALAGVLGHRFPRLRPLLYPAAAAVACSRVYTAAHYPLDVAAGALLGAAVAVAVNLAAPLLAATVDRLHLHHAEPRGRTLHALLLLLMGLLLTWQAFKTKQVPESWRWPLFLTGLACLAIAALRLRPLARRLAPRGRTA